MLDEWKALSCAIIPHPPSSRHTGALGLVYKHGGGAGAREVGIGRYIDHSFPEVDCTLI